HDDFGGRFHRAPELEEQAQPQVLFEVVDQREKTQYQTEETERCAQESGFFKIGHAPLRRFAGAAARSGQFASTFCAESLGARYRPVAPRAQGGGKRDEFAGGLRPASAPAGFSAADRGGGGCDETGAAWRSSARACAGRLRRLRD